MTRLLSILLLLATVALLAHIALVDIAAQSEPRPTPTPTVAGPQPLPTISRWEDARLVYLPYIAVSDAQNANLGD